MEYSENPSQREKLDLPDSKSGCDLSPLNTRNIIPSSSLRFTLYCLELGLCETDGERIQKELLTSLKVDLSPRLATRWSMASATAWASAVALPELSFPMYGKMRAICLASSGFLSALKRTVGAKLMHDVMPWGIAYVVPMACPMLWLKPKPVLKERENIAEYAAMRSF
jgi:hypothetical protein